MVNTEGQDYCRHNNCRLCWDSVAPLARQSSWKYILLEYLHENELASFLSFLRPMASSIGSKLGVAGCEVIDNLAVYTHFRKVNEPIPAELIDRKLSEVFGDMTIRSYNILRRYGVYTVRDLLKFPEERITCLKPHDVFTEISCIKRRIKKSFGEGVTE